MPIVRTLELLQPVRSGFEFRPIGNLMDRRTTRIELTDTGKIILLPVAILLLACVGVLLGRVVAARMLRADALSTSESWATSLARIVDDLPAVVAGQQPAAESTRLLAAASQVGDTYRYRIWDRNGRLVYASERIASETAPKNLNEVLGQDGARSVLEGKETTQAYTSAKGKEPEDYAISFIPIERNGQAIGAFEIYLDQTSDKALYERSFFLTEAIIAAVTLIAGGVPALLVFRKMRDHRKAEAEAVFLAEHDALTGLPNRRWMEERTIGAFARAKRNQSPIAAVLIDLDRFKQVNDSLGHRAGDELLKGFAQRLKAAARSEDLVARLGGDEFVVLQSDTAQPASAARLTERLLKNLSEPFDIGGVKLSGSASIGVAVFPTDAKDWDALLSCADAASYKVKAEGGNAVCFFETGMDAKLRERRQIEQDVRRALDTGALQLAFQPQLDLRNHRLVGFEALARWPANWPARSPAEFIPVAEESGLMVRLGEWVLESACRTAASWEKPLKVAVNLSPMQFRQGDVVEAVERALHVSGLKPDRLELEVTETAWLHNTDAVLDQLAWLRSMGISIALDDFGTGYSSLSYLWRFPFDKVKIDRSFVSEMQSDPKATAIVNSVVALARTLDLTVTAEGVELPIQESALRGVGCDLAQGYLFGRPIPEGQVATWIETETAPNETIAIKTTEAVSRAEELVQEMI
jgi:diguanylate cyclase (GGDEF)-like protein